MRSAAFFATFILYLTVPVAFAFPGMVLRQNTNEKGVQITLPAQQNNGLKMIPGISHLIKYLLIVSHSYCRCRSSIYGTRTYRSARPMSYV